MGEYDRIVYILWWESGIADYWSVKGTYTSKREALAAAKHLLEHNNGDGQYFVAQVILSDISRPIRDITIRTGYLIL